MSKDFRNSETKDNLMQMCIRDRSGAELLKMDIKIIRVNASLLGCSVHLFVCIHNYGLFVMKIIFFQEGIINKPAQ